MCVCVYTQQSDYHVEMSRPLKHSKAQARTDYIIFETFFRSAAAVRQLWLARRNVCTLGAASSCCWIFITRVREPQSRRPSATHPTANTHTRKCAFNMPVSRVGSRMRLYTAPQPQINTVRVRPRPERGPELVKLVNT